MKRLKKWKSKNLLPPLVFSLLAGGVFGLSVFAFLSRDLPNPAQLTNRQLAQSTKIYDRSGMNLLYEIHSEEKRTVILFEDVPERMKQATIAIEDGNFYLHPAFDWRALIRGVLLRALQGKSIQGGSTITQQLAKNAFLSPERTVQRKLKELILAFQLERQYTKDEILGLYLNQVPYGANSYGVEAASQTYFNKPARELNLAEAALLASLPQAPSYYSPWGYHQDELETRKNYVLERMGQLGFIDEEEKNRALNHKFIFAPQSASIKAPHFVMAVKEYLNNRYGEEVVENGGLKVVTTLDVRLQEIAERAVREGAQRNEELYLGKNAALAAQDSATGQILAMVGSRDHSATSSLPVGCTPGLNCQFEPYFNVATQGLRQPGSAFKPIAYITAFQKGFTPETVVLDVPTEFAADNPDCPAIVNFTETAPEASASEEDEWNKCYHPENFDERFRGPVTFREALAQSINVPSVKVLYLAGLNDVLDNAKKFGITTLNEPSRYGLSLVLGGGEVKLIDLVSAYSVFAQEGQKHDPALILEVRDSAGKILEKYEDRPEQVIEPRYARLINDILSDKEARAPLFSASLGLTYFSNQETALKTGTTNDYRDAWAVGYTPSLTAGVWAGNNDNSPMQRRGNSILAAVPIWNAFMKEALKEYPLETFNRPEPVPAEKLVLRGEKTISYKAYIDRRTGSLATGETPSEFIQEKEYPQLHSILYYADKSDPAGPPPQNPEKDPQFKNWEGAVLAWGKKNVSGFENYNQIPPTQDRIFNQEAFRPKISNFSPKSGVFVAGEVSVKAEVSSVFDLELIELVLNDQRIDRRQPPLGKNYRYEFIVKPEALELQNSLKITAADIFGNQSEHQVIVFK